MKVKVKIIIVCVMSALFIAAFSSNKYLTPTVESLSGGPPAGMTGAPGESTCRSCHIPDAGSGSFIITAPPSYVPGQTYQLQLTHATSDATRSRWGFEMTSLATATTTQAGTFANLSPSTQIIGGGGRSYIEHTSEGTFPGQSGGAQWTVSWTAPATDVGTVRFYAAGNQANGDGTNEGDQIYTTNATVPPAAGTPTPTPTPATRTPFDFDGDAKTDVSIFRSGRASGAEWWHLRSSDGGNGAVQFGASTDRMTPADFTGDRKTDVAFFRPATGQWFVLRSEDFSFFAFPFGTNGDIPAPADFDGDGKADAAVFRPSAATWFISRSSDGGTTISQFGAAGDLPVNADYDGDGKSDIAIYRPTVAEWWIQRSTAGLTALQFGAAGDKTVPGDFTGDGKADVAFWRPATGQWFILRSEDYSFFAFPFGSNGDVPVPGDYDGDGRFDAAVFRPSSSTWFVNRSTAGTLIQQFGAAGDVPVPNAFVR